MYAAVLRTPYALRTFGSALVGRLSYGTVSLSLMLAVKAATGSYAVAGTVMAVFGAASVFLSPLRARFIDRYGPRRALTPMALGYAALLGVLAAVTWRPGAPGWLLVALALCAGAATPPLGPAMRTVWSQLLPDRRLLQRAYSLDGVAEELLFVSGPLIVGVLVLFAPAAFGVALSAGLVAVGTLVFVASPMVGAVAPAGRQCQERARVVGRIARPVIATLGVGLALGAADLLVLAFAEDRGRADAAAWVLAALSAGSAVGGLVNGAVDWRLPARTRLTLLTFGLAAALGAAALAPGLLTLAAAAACVGLFVAPALTTAYLIADDAVDPGLRTQAGAWVNTAVNAGSSGGTAGMGLLVSHAPLPLCFAAAATAPLLAGLAAAFRAGQKPAPPALEERGPGQSPVTRTPVGEPQSSSPSSPSSSAE
ncbi:MFS transporter [Streptomyces kunmingensis]|uniref:MFS transporter n=1 Tax=Streptomyces kunmingensis TaxID=68225 RepID=A0ABU6C5E6_9ACTN|nr:MFS transporter [Streptomyces kunmingensis]MEB3959341.1 MFS transporter [Streptomyces kunmingensis]